MSHLAVDTLPPVVTYACRLKGITPLNTDTYQVELQSPADTVLTYHPGQHLQLELDMNDDGQRSALLYSIANGCNPEQPRRLQLFIQNTSERSDKVLKHLYHLQTNDHTLQVTLPMGQAFLQTDLNLPHLLIAAGSGISKIKCLMEAILRHRPDADVKTYWSNKQANDFYLLEQFQYWVKQHKNLSFTSILESPHPEFPGRSGYIYQIIQDDLKDLHSTQAYLCGSPRMVYGTLDKLKAHGLKEEHCYSDAFHYAPRQQKIASQPNKTKH